MKADLLPSAGFTDNSEAKCYFSKTDIHGNTAPLATERVMKATGAEGLLLWSCWETFVLPHGSSGHHVGTILPIDGLLCHIIHPWINLAEGLRN